MGNYTRGGPRTGRPTYRPVPSRADRAPRQHDHAALDIKLPRPGGGKPPTAPYPNTAIGARALSDSALRRLTLRQHGKAPPQTAPRAQGPSGAQDDVPLAGLATEQRKGPDRFSYVDLAKAPVQKRLLERMPPAFWLRNAAMPWLELGDTVVVAMADLSKAGSVEQALRPAFGRIIPVRARADHIHDLLTEHLKHPMARQASASVPFDLSSRFLSEVNLHSRIPIWAGLLLGLTLFFPTAVFTAFCGLTLLLILLFTGFRLAGFAGFLHQRLRPAPEPPRRPPKQDLPAISMLVPLFKEAEISKDLLSRLKLLRYPHSLLEVFLVLEEDDSVTWSAVQQATLPDWISIVSVPAYGDLKTKPRALNYALNHCNGEIIGVWDAEDAPMPDQLHRVAEAFAGAASNVACLQGILDYYNPRASWISRCFTLEYASWFRIVLQGIARMGLVVPLGGTTMFIRREVLERIGGWDAHNVTEDADLGVRLCRAGYRTEMVASTTYEEANARLWPWIKQRSRWLKGFMVTYIVHMRDPRRLLRDLGWRQFLGVQVFFLCSVGQFLLAPFLWSFWLVTLGLPHPSTGSVPGMWLSLAAASLVFFELLNQMTAMAAAFAAGRWRLALWAPCLLFYYVMGAAAAYKALYELVVCPFFWDKTDHGLHAPEPRAGREPPPHG